MNNSNNNDSVYNPLEWKYVKGYQDSTKQQNGKNYQCCCNQNDGRGMWVVHLPEEWKYSETPNARFQNPRKSENDNQTAELGDRHLTLSENIQASLISNIQLYKNEVNKLISA